MALKRVSELDPNYRKSIMKDLESGRMTFDEVAKLYGVSELDVRMYYRDHRHGMEKTARSLYTLGYL